MRATNDRQQSSTGSFLDPTLAFASLNLLLSSRIHVQVNPNIRRDKWTADEDAKLIELVKTFGVGRWAEIARNCDGRTDQQCMGRWRRHLDPSIRRVSRRPLAPQGCSTASEQADARDRGTCMGLGVLRGALKAGAGNGLHLAVVQ